MQPSGKSHEVENSQDKFLLDNPLQKKTNALPAQSLKNQYYIALHFMNFLCLRIVAYLNKLTYISLSYRIKNTKAPNVRKCGKRNIFHIE